MNEFVFRNEKFLPTQLESEAHLESLIIENRDILFPNAYIFDYKRQAKTFQNDQSTTADMCLVSHDCSRWWIIEVERSKGVSYAYDVVQPQIALQADADWNKSSHHAVAELVKLGVEKTKAENIISIEPGFILLYDDANEIYSEIAIEHMFKQIIFKPFLSEKGNYALVPLKQEINPKPAEENSYFVESSRMKVRAKIIWIPVDKNLKDRIGEKKISVTIDGNLYPICSRELQTLNMIKIPITQDDNSSQTNQLIYKRLQCIFDIEEDESSLNLRFRETRKWKR